MATVEVVSFGFLHGAPPAADLVVDLRQIVTVAAGCAGGRHRAPTVAREIAARLIAAGHAVIVHHRDLEKPVVQR